MALDDAETAHLFRLAGQRPPSRETPQPALQPGYRMLLDQLLPCPAMITNHRFDVIAWNRASTLLFGDFGRFEGDERNMLWYTFSTPQARTLVVDWEADAAFMVALFRTQATELLHTAPFVSLVDRLRSTSAEFSALWERRDLEQFRPVDQQVQHPLLGRIRLRPLKLYAVDQDRTVVAYLTDPSGDTHRRLARALDAATD
ncbi:MmyB family transcriptional regulator [Microlunatus soli]|uniref:MmyB family transcriptional regulator n=1 Tax=Microlunatus soli TaxID=630515 RepID=UPI001E5450EB|nr:hypothetical protein [Microlunatus soli]